MKYDLKNEKIAVHCQTLEEAEKVQAKGIDLGLCASHLVNYFKEGNRIFIMTKNDLTCGTFLHRDMYDKLVNASEYLSQFEEVPKYGDKVWVRDFEEDGWTERIFIDLCEGKCRCVKLGQEGIFLDGRDFTVISWSHYRTTDPSLDLPTLTLQEIADLKGVSIEQAKEMVTKIKE